MKLDNIQNLENYYDGISFEKAGIERYLTEDCKIPDKLPNKPLGTIKEIYDFFFESRQRFHITTTKCFASKKEEETFLESRYCLENYFQYGLVNCREYSIMAQILLSQIGIPSLFVSLYEHANDEGKIEHKHDFLLYSKNDKLYVFDAANHINGELPAEKIYDNYDTYRDGDKVFYNLVKPINIDPDYKEVTGKDYGFLIKIEKEEDEEEDEECGCLVM